MNGFTTTETDATDADLALQAERLHMALCEAGYPRSRVVVEDGLLVAYNLGRRQPALKAWHTALGLVRPDGRRCWPCRLADDHYPRVSPDCEGTGRCGSAE